MKPRIFISSTCYDLKFVREDLADFVIGYDYETILSENGDIGYTPGQNLDKSCYAAMQTADMVILIIGSEYGSAASGETKKEFEEYISVTRNEFRTAVESGIPIFVMIDKKVMAEYGVYDANYNAIEKENREMAFPTTKNINVFRFIREIKGIVTLPIQEFERSAEIKGFISKQWADMFKNYLSSLRSEKENKKIENSVNEMKALIQKMNIMLDSVGKNVLSKENPEEYDKVINQQELLEFCDIFVNAFVCGTDAWNSSYESRKEFVARLLDCLLDLKKNNLITDQLFDDFGLYEKCIRVFEKNGLETPIILLNNVKEIEKKMDLLSNGDNKNAIIEIMSQKEYFTKLTAS